jgi:C4-dicarboxylate-specific signal transduction histidine kinase
MFDIAKNEAVTNGTITRVVHPDDRETAIGALRTSNLTKRSVRTEFRVILADRNVRWYLAHAQVDVNSDGEPTKISGVVSDITNRKEADAEAALQRNEIAHLMRVAMLGELSGGIAHELTQPITAILSNAQAARAMLANKRWQRGELAEIIDDIIFDDNRDACSVKAMQRSTPSTSMP